VVPQLNFPHVREFKAVLDSGFHTLDSVFQVLDSSLFQWNLDSGFQSLVGIRIPWNVFWIPKPRIPNSTSQIFPVFWIPQSKISQILESWLPYSRPVNIMQITHPFCYGTREINCEHDNTGTFVCFFHIIYDLFEDCSAFRSSNDRLHFGCDGLMSASCNFLKITSSR